MRRPEDFRVALRRGHRIATPALVLHIVHRAGVDPARFGFIVSKAVGGAVVRNLVRRRLRAISLGLLSDVDPGTDVVVRALPGAASASWDTLQAEVVRGVATRHGKGAVTR